jgi:DNA polymerase IV
MIFHIDMDAFYASVEILDNPEFKGKPVIVGGLSGRGVVAAASYEARKYGVHSAMPMFQALKNCPDARVVPPRMARYKNVSENVMEILRSFSPLVEQVSIDEAYLNANGCERLFGSADTMAGEIKNKIKQKVHLTCSVGIAPVKFLAKIASNMNKPDGVTIIYPEQVPGFVQSLPIKNTPGVGPSLFQELRMLGITTLGDIQNFPEKVLTDKLGKFGKRLKELSMGIDTSPIVPYSLPKSASAEETLGFDTADRELLKKYLLQQADEVGRQLRKTGVKAKTVSIKVKHSDFQQITRRITLKSPTCSSNTLFHEACRLFDECVLLKKVRLIGIGASGFVHTNHPVQMKLFDIPNQAENNWEKVDKTLDMIQERFGKEILGRATFNDS